MRERGGGGVGPTDFFSPPPPVALQSLGDPDIRQSSSIQDGLWRLHACFEGAFTKFRKATSPCLSCPRRTPRLPLGGFLRLIEEYFFEKPSRKIQVPLQSANNGHFTRRPVHFTCRPVNFTYRPVHFTCRTAHFICRPVHFTCRPVNFTYRPVHFTCRPAHFNVDLCTSHIDL